MEIYQTSQWVPFPLESVFAFFANPSNLPNLMPSEQRARIELMRLQPAPSRIAPTDSSPRHGGTAAGEGSEIVVSFRPVRWLPYRSSWTARTLEFIWNRQFKDEIVRGPLKGTRHLHQFRVEVRNGAVGTLITDSLEFFPHGGVMARLASKSVRAGMETSFAFRQTRLPELLNVAALQLEELLPSPDSRHSSE